MLLSSCCRLGSRICKRLRQSPLGCALRAGENSRMLPRFAAATIVSLVMLLGTPAFADIYSNLTPNNLMATAIRPDSPGSFEIETGDDFFLGTGARINSAKFVGLSVPGAGGTPAISQVVVEIYRVFPNDSDVGRTSGPPTFSTSQVPTRVNSPSDVELVDRDSASGNLTFSTSILAASFTASNSVKPGGIHPTPGQTTGGNGSVTGQETQIVMKFTTPFNLPADHYFFVPQVELSDGDFFWLSAPRPIVPPGTPFPPGSTDLQSWTRDQMLNPDWLRIGTDIVGGATPPTF